MAQNATFIKIRIAGKYLVGEASVSVSGSSDVLDHSSKKSARVRRILAGRYVDSVTFESLADDQSADYGFKDAHAAMKAGTIFPWLVARVLTSIKQKDTVTLTGASGTANITGAGGLTKLATYATSLTVTASDFVTAHAAAYLAVGIVLTSSGADLIFEASIAGNPFAIPVIANATGDLAGTVVSTTDGVVTIDSGVGYIASLTKDHPDNSISTFSGSIRVTQP